MVKTLPSNLAGAGLIPGWGTKIPHVSEPKKQNIKQINVATNSIETIKKERLFLKLSSIFYYPNAFKKKFVTSK